MDDEYDELLGDDEDWEDQRAYEAELEKMPNGWFMIKIVRFDAARLIEIDEWCSINCQSAYKRIGWSSGCSYSVAVQFSDSRDAVFFKMWS